MKKIMIMESNNNIMNGHAKSFIHQDSENLNELRTYILDSADFLGLSDFDLFIQVMTWVNTRWSHDGINDAGNASSLDILKRASNGESFRCVEYAKVTKDILLAMGYIARSMSILAENADYAGFGQAHAITEVWSNRFEKWVFLDPQINVYATKDEIPQSFYEIYTSFEDISFTFLSEEPLINESEYRDFIGRYFGYVGTKSLLNGIKTDIFLKLKGTRQLLAFQAMQFSNSLFTEKVDEIYYHPNHTTVLFEYKESVDPLKIVSVNNLTNVEEMKAHMDLFCAKPDFILRFISQTPDLSHYELVINEGNPVIVTDSTYDWSITKEDNSIQVCAVNKQGIKGSMTEIKIHYK